jgi:hypothetical protein
MTKKHQYIQARSGKTRIFNAVDSNGWSEKAAADKEDDQDA